MEDGGHLNDIPIWFNGTQRWMTALTKRTTCDDVIYAILFSCGLHETEATDNYAIFEKWREVERPLSARTKILKIWTIWGEEQPNVQLSMRSLDDYFLPGESSLYLRSRRRHKRSSRHRSRHTVHCKCHNKRGCTECSRLRSLEQLVKLVVGQERKIQDLSDRIYDTDKLIDRHEARIHQHRVQQNGMDYVQNSYLNSHSSESSSSIDGSTFTSLDMKDLKSIFQESTTQELEEITRLCDSLAHVERRLAQEHAKLKEVTPEVEKLATKLGVAARVEGETSVELEQARVQMIRAVTTHVNNEYNERELERKLEICLGDLTAKADLMEALQRELSELGEDRRSERSEDNDLAIKISIARTHSIDATAQSLHPYYSHTDNVAENKPRSEQHLGSSAGPVSNLEYYRTYERYHPGRGSNRTPSTSASSFASSPAELYAPSSPHQHLPGQNSHSYSQSSSNIHNTHLGNISSDPVTNNIIAKVFEKDITHSQGSKSVPGFLNSNSKQYMDTVSANSHQRENNVFIGYQPRQGRATRKRQEDHRLYNRSRSAERASSGHRQRSPGPPFFDVGSRAGNFSHKTAREADKNGPRSTYDATQDIVNQYGLEVHTKPRQLETDACTTKFLPNRLRTPHIPAGQTQSQLQSRQHVPTRELCESHHASQHQRLPEGWSGPRIYADADRHLSADSSKYSRESNHSISGGQTCPPHAQHTSTTRVNTEDTGENMGPQSNRLNTLSNSRAGVQNLETARAREVPVFEQRISDRGGQQDHNGGFVQDLGINNDKKTLSTLGKVLDMDNRKGIHSRPEFQHGPARGVDAASLPETSFPLEFHVCDNAWEPQPNKHRELMQPYSMYTANLSHQSGKQTNETRSSRQTADVHTDRQTWSGQLPQDKLENNPFSSNGETNWMNTQHWNHPSHQQGQTSSAASHRQQFTSQMQSHIYSPSIQDGATSVHPGNRMGVTDRTWSDNDDVFPPQADITGPYHAVGKQVIPATPEMVRTNNHYQGKFGNRNPLSNSFPHPSVTNSASNQAASLQISPGIRSPDRAQADTTERYQKVDDPKRGALYNIVSNKLSKPKTSASSDVSHDRNHETTDSTSIHSQNETPASTNIESLSSANSYNKANGHPTSDFAKSEFLTFDNSFPVNQTIQRYPVSSDQKMNVAEVAQSAHPNTLKPPTERSNGRRRAMNPHFCDVSDDNKLSAGMPDKANHKNIQQSFQVTFQNSVNHSKGTVGGGILKTNYHASNLNSNTQISDTVNIKSIIQNRDANLGQELSNKNSKGGPRVTILTNSHVNGTKAEDSNDSNSDTGLSSMHSDETANMETLV